MLTRLAWEVSWWKSNFWENANFCIFLPLPSPVIRSQPLPNWTLTITGSFARFVFSHTHNLPTLIESLSIWALIEEEMMIYALIPVKTASCPLLIHQSWKLCASLTGNSLTRDIYLDPRPPMKQLIKPIFTFAVKHASWYGGKGGLLELVVLVGHLISAGNMVKRV